VTQPREGAEGRLSCADPRLPGARNRVDVLFAVLTAGLVLCVGSFIAAGFHAPLSYDGAYNMQVPLHLAHEGRYATDGAVYDGRVKHFDAYITTGPTVLIPVAAAVAVLGDHLWAMRVAPTAFFLLLLCTAAGVGRRSAGRWGAFVAVAAVLAVDLGATQPGSPVFGSGDVVGEMACALLLLWAATNLQRTRLAGLAFGLAVLTKMLAGIMLPAFVGALVIISIGMRTRHRLGSLLTFAAWACAPAVAWSLVRLTSLGWNEYQLRCVEFVQVFLSKGSGLTSGTDRSPEQRLASLLDLFQLPAVLIGLPVIAAALVLTCISNPPGRPAQDPPHANSGRATAVAAIGGTALLGAWWLLVSDVAFVRHLLIGVFVALPVACSQALRIVTLTRSQGSIIRRLLAPALVTALCASAAVTAVRVWSPNATPLQDQRSAAAVVANADVEQIRTVGWWQVPEIAYLARTPARPLTEEGGLLVSELGLGLVDIRAAELVSAACGREIYRQGGYLICDAAQSP
jgi:4-amino-4-deoxy-L-arabinose transferase-like glycosyltransferase